MTIRRSAFAAMLLSILGGGNCLAQDASRVGVAMGYPAAVGVIWEATNRLAIRPEVTFSFMSGDSSDATGTIAGTSSAWTAGVGVSALFYIGGAADVRTYLSPKFSYWHNSSSAGLAPGGSRSQNASSDYAVAGSFGAQYALGKRFSVYGEVGLTYAWQTSSFSSTTANVVGTDSTAHSVGTRSAVGVIAFF
jgi:hypothetical protein